MYLSKVGSNTTYSELYCIQIKKKKNYSDKNQIRVARACDRRTRENKNKREKEQERNFFGNIAVAHPDCGRAYIITCIRQNSQNYTLKEVKFIVCKIVPQ